MGECRLEALLGVVALRRRIATSLMRIMAPNPMADCARDGLHGVLMRNCGPLGTKMRTEGRDRKAPAELATNSVIVLICDVCECMAVQASSLLGSSDMMQ